MWKTYEIEPALFLMLFSISFGQSEESSNEVNCFFTDNAKILISELYYGQFHTTATFLRLRHPSCLCKLVGLCTTGVGEYEY